MSRDLLNGHDMLKQDRFFCNLVGEEAPRDQGLAARSVERVKCLLSNDSNIVLRILSTSAMLEKIFATALLICTVKLNLSLKRIHL